MNIQRGMGRHRIGGWDFFPDSGEVRRRSDVRRLEPRAAKVLELLCQADGGVVSHDQLIRDVWGGRSLSENSVAVVIGQLRKALDDDAREPRLIETISKRGYRLCRAASEPPEAVAERGIGRRSALALLGAGALLAGGAALWWTAGREPGGRAIQVEDVVNETGNAAYAPHVRATSELIVTQLSRRGFDVRRSGDQQGLRLTSKLVMWNGEPFLGMTLTDERSRVLWSAMVKGGPADVPRTVAAELDGLQIKFSAN